MKVLYHRPSPYRQLTFDWGNWTFGIWYSKKLMTGGWDFGPLEYVRKHR